MRGTGTPEMGPSKRSPPSNMSRHPAGNGWSPSLRRRQVLRALLPPERCVPSGMVTSVTKRALRYGSVGTTCRAGPSSHAPPAGAVGWRHPCRFAGASRVATFCSGGRSTAGAGRRRKSVAGAAPLTGRPTSCLAPRIPRHQFRQAALVRRTMPSSRSTKSLTNSQPTGPRSSTRPSSSNQTPASGIPLVPGCTRLHRLALVLFMRNGPREAVEATESKHTMASSSFSAVAGGVEEDEAAGTCTAAWFSSTRGAAASASS
mmetsp:Transcript_12148/g.35173  ORF Transcript_12148/g.35173 Transcript_12148/m.35173 type:complete len:260 (+) Transcript_12148:662-1441(+)